MQTRESAIGSSDSSASSSSSASPTPTLEMQPLRQKPEIPPQVKKLQKLPPPVVDLATPEIITVEGTPPPLPSQQQEPVVVDLSQSDQAEIRGLYVNFCQMFPETPKQYLEQQAGELVGKPAAIDRFIDELVSNNSKPPEYWKPDVVPVWDSPAPAVNALNMTQRPKPKKFDLPSGPWQDLFAAENDLNHLTREITKDKLNDAFWAEEKETPVPGPSGTQKNPNPIGEATIPNTNVPGASSSPVQDNVEAFAAQNSVRDATGSGEEPSGVRTAVPDTEEEKRERQMEIRVQNILALFPQKDPEFLHTKSNEFALDTEGVAAFVAWVNEVVENGGRDLPSREEYDRRKKVR